MLDESLEEATTHVFVKNHIFSSCTDLKMLRNNFSYTWGFKCSRFDFALRCNRYGSIGDRKRDKGNQYTRQHKHTFRCNCEWKINFRFIDKSKQKTEDAVIITNVYSKHTNTCTPGKDQLVWARSISGEYSKFTKKS